MALDPCKLLATGREVVWHSPEGVDRAIVRRGRAVDRNLVLNRRQDAQISDDRAHVLFVEVGEVIPRHALPVQLAPVAADAAANGARDLRIAPRAEAGFHI